MTNEEKFKLILKFLDKAILGNDCFKVTTSGVFSNVHIEGESSLLTVYSTKNGLELTLSMKNLGRTTFNVNEVQVIELKYKSNILQDKQEARLLNFLNEQ